MNTFFATRIMRRIVTLLMCASSVIVLTACTNLTQLRDKLNTVSYTPHAINYVLDEESIDARFKVGSTKGRFRVLSGQLGFDTPQIHSGKLAVTLATGSVDLANPLLEEMLRGKDWFASSEHPLAFFRTLQLHLPVDSINTATLAAQGELSLRNVTQPLTLTVNLTTGLTNLNQPPAQIGFTAMGEFSRASFGMQGLEEFAPDLVELEITGRFLLQDGANTKTTKMSAPID